MTLPKTQKVAKRLDIARAAAVFATTRDSAVQRVREGRIQDARWWGAQARSDWRALHHLLTR